MNWKNIFRDENKFDTIEDVKEASDEQLRYIFEETLFHSFNIDTGTEYKFYYDDFFQHLLDDVKKYKSKISRVEKFKSQLMNHIYSTKYSIIKNPGDYPEVRQLLRLKKLEKLKNEI